MRKIKIKVSIGLVGCQRTTEIEVEDDATEEEIEKAAFEAVCEMIEWSYEEK